MSTHDIAAPTHPWEVVIARYDEDLSWVKPIAANAHVYNKGREDDAVLDDLDRTSFASWNMLPNIGREGDTYLHHIINRYERTPSDMITIFLQGKIDDHIRGDPLSFVRACIMQASKALVSVPPYSLQAHYGFRHKTYFGKNLDISPHGPFGEWFEKFVSKPFPAPGQPMPFYQNGLFAVSWKRIRGRPVGYYQRIKDTISSEDPETGHYLERSWAYIFSKLAPVN